MTEEKNKRDVVPLCGCGLDMKFIGLWNGYKVFVCVNDACKVRRLINPKGENYG